MNLLKHTEPSLKGLFTLIFSEKCKEYMIYNIKTSQERREILTIHIDSHIYFYIYGEAKFD